MTGRPVSIDEFLEDLSPKKRAALERIRSIPEDLIRRLVRARIAELQGEGTFTGGSVVESLRGSASCEPLKPA
jgi:hypothetical protein